MLASEHPFNVKSDNFLELDKINNLIVSSLTDEEVVG